MSNHSSGQALSSEILFTVVFTSDQLKRRHKPGSPPTGKAVGRNLLWHNFLYCSDICYAFMRLYLFCHITEKSRMLHDGCRHCNMSDFGSLREILQHFIHHILNHILIKPHKNPFAFPVMLLPHVNTK